MGLDAEFSRVLSRSQYIMIVPSMERGFRRLKSTSKGVRQIWCWDESGSIHTMLWGGSKYNQTMLEKECKWFQLIYVWFPTMYEIPSNKPIKLLLHLTFHNTRNVATIKSYSWTGNWSCVHATMDAAVYYMVHWNINSIPYNSNAQTVPNANAFHPIKCV